MIEAHLNKVTLGAIDYEPLQADNINDLIKTLQQADLQTVINMLYAEIMGENRPTFISRLYQWYHILSADRDREALTKWAARKRCIVPLPNYNTSCI